MSIRKTLGGDRLGSGNKMKIEMHGYERSTHDLSYKWENTQAPGTLVPFLVEIALPGDTFDIELDCDIMTHPTIGPLLGSFKIQLDVLEGPIRLYNAQLHNNKLGIGMRMADIKLPLIRLTAWPYEDDPADGEDLDNSQINPSCILHYLGMHGIGRLLTTIETPANRDFNATAFILYWDIYKQYFSNKQEEIGAVIHTEATAIITTVIGILIEFEGGTDNVPEHPNPPAAISTNNGTTIELTYAGATPNLEQIMLITSAGIYSLNELKIGNAFEPIAGTISFTYDYTKYGTIVIQNWRYIRRFEMPIVQPRVQTFPLVNIDTMREEILERATIGATPFIINGVGSGADIPPYSYITFKDFVGFFDNLKQTQEGLALKTYQSDIFNNWLKEEWITGPGSIADLTAIDTSGGSFTIDTLNLSKKVYEMLNRIAVSGGTYEDWLEVTYDHQRHIRTESPIYHGGLIKELAFQELVSTADSTTQPLGTLAGKGVLTKKHKGGRITIKVDEPSYLMGIISITPRLDYSQGNRWDIHLKTLDDLHKPQLDEIGFEDDITERRAWWDTYFDVPTNEWIQKSAGKQPAYMNYRTNHNRAHGNFAVRNNEMFMTLNRRYEYVNNGDETSGIADLTTYIDPAKYNHIFAQTSLDAMNFWVQVGVNMTVRRKMSARLMPNL